MYSELHHIMDQIRITDPDAGIHIIDCFTLWLWSGYFGLDQTRLCKPQTLGTVEFESKIITKNKLTRERRKGVKSKFKKYFDTLPEEFSVPLTMTEEEFQLLPRQLKRRAERERKRLKKRFEHLKFITQSNFTGMV